MKQLGASCPRIVRVYSEIIEQKEFPLPGKSPGPRKTSGSYTSMDPELRDVALHHLIRKNTAEHSPHILAMDQKISQDSETISPEEWLDYTERIGMAKAAELRKADIVLCTCTASSSYNMRKYCNIQQVRRAEGDILFLSFLQPPNKNTGPSPKSW